MSLPAPFGTVTITEDYVDFAGAIGTGTVTFTPVTGDWLDLPATHVTVVPKPITASLDLSGHLSITVPLTNDPDVVPTFTYQVTEAISGLTRTRTIEVPSSMLPGPIPLDTLATTGSVPSGTTALTKQVADTYYTQRANNLSDVISTTTARTNLGLGSAATQSVTAFDAAGAAAAVTASSAQKSANLSDLASAATARTNLGLGSAATQATSAFDAAGVAAGLVAPITAELGSTPQGSFTTVKARLDAYGGVITVGPSLSGARYEYGVSAFSNDVGAAVNQALADNPKRTVRIVGANLHPIKTPINLGTQHGIEGEGPYQTMLDVQSTFTGDGVIISTRDTNGYRHRVANLGIDGHVRDSRTSGHGVHLTISAPPVGYGAGGFGPDPSPAITNVGVFDVSGDAIALDGTDPANSGALIGARVSEVRAQHIGGWGVRAQSSDVKLNTIVVNDCSSGGFWLDGGNIQGSVLRSTFAGNVGALAPGFKITGGRIVLHGPVAQDNLGLGFDVSSDNVSIIGAIADSNGDGLTATTASGFNLTGTRLYLTGESFMRTGGGAQSKLSGAGQKFGVRFGGTSVINSYVCLVFGTPTNPSPWSAVSSGTIGTGSTFTSIGS